MAVPGSGPRSRRARGDGRAQRHARFLLRRRPFPERDAALRPCAAHDRGGRRHHRCGRRVHAARCRRRLARRRTGARHPRHRSAAARIRRSSSRSTPASPKSCARRCDAGADIINDVRALAAPGALAAAASTRRRRLPHAHAGRAAHHAGRAALRRRGGRGQCVFSPRVSPRAATAGIDAARLAVDPGFGFGKRIVDNLALLKHLARVRRRWASRCAVGLSRKSMLAQLTGREVDDRTAGSVALAAIAVLNGARIVRAHDVAATVDAIRVAAAVSQGEDFDGT